MKRTKFGFWACILVIIYVIIFNLYEWILGIPYLFFANGVDMTLMLIAGLYLWGFED